MKRKLIMTTRIAVTLLAMVLVTQQGRAQPVADNKDVDISPRVKMLLGAMRSDDAKLRSAAVKALGAMRDGPAVDALLELADDADPAVRLEAMTALANIGSRRCFDEFTAALTDPDPRVRGEALWGLCKLSDPRSAETLVHWCLAKGRRQQGPHGTARIDEALVRIGDPAVEHLEAMLGRSASHRSMALQLLVRLKTPRAVEALAGAARDKRWRIRSEALAALTSTTSRPWATIVEALDDPNTTVQQRAVQVVGDLINDRDISGLSLAQKKKLRSDAIDALARMLRQTGSPIRSQVLGTLRSTRDARLVAPICEMLRDGSATERREAASALSSIADKTTVPTLLAATEDPDTSVRNYALRLLVRIGGADALPGLILAAKQPAHYYRSSPTTPVGAIAKIETPEATAALIALVGDAPESTQLSAIKALADIRTAQTAKAIAQTARSHASAKVRKYALTLLATQMMNRTTHTLCNDTFTAALNDGDPTVRIEAVKHGWKLPHKAGLTLLLLGLADSNDTVRSAAAEALGELGTDDAWKALLAAVDKESALTALAAMGRSFARPEKAPYCVPGQLAVLKRLIVLRETPQGSDSLSGVGQLVIDRLGLARDKRATRILCSILTTDRDTYWRKQAAQALGVIKDAAGIEALIKALGDESTSVSNVAVFALSGLADKTTTEAILKATNDPKAGAGAAIVLAVLDSKLAFGPYMQALRANTTDPGASGLATAIERSGKRDVVEGLIAALETGPTQVRQLAINRMVLTRDRRVVAPLWNALTQREYSDVRRAASSALERLKHLGVPVDQPRKQTPAR